MQFLGTQHLTIILAIIASVKGSNLYFQPETLDGAVFYTEDGSSSGASGTFDTSLGLGNCGCNNVPNSWPTVCVHFHMKGQAVDMYTGSGCSGTWLGAWDGVREIDECGWRTFQMNSFFVHC